jgi:hypothetical protein
MVQLGELFRGQSIPSHGKEKKEETSTYVCKLIRFCEALFTPSIISISPLAGQFGPRVQSLIGLVMDYSMLHIKLTSRPGSTDATWHMNNVGNKQAVGICSFAGYTNTLSTIYGVVRQMVDAHISWPSTDSRDEGVRSRSRLVDILYQTMRGIRIRKKVEAIKEARSRIFGTEDVGITRYGGHLKRKQGRKCQTCRSAAPQPRRGAHILL